MKKTRKTKTRKSSTRGEQELIVLDAQRNLSEQLKSMTKPQLLNFIDGLKQAFDKNADEKATEHAKSLMVEKAKYSSLTTELDNVRRERQRLYEEVQFLKPVVNKLVRS